MRWLFQHVPVECQALEVSFDLHQACIALLRNDITSAYASYFVARARTGFADADFWKVKLECVVSTPPTPAKTEPRRMTDSCWPSQARQRVDALCYKLFIQNQQLALLAMF